MTIKFHKGDKVYCPMLDTKIHTISMTNDIKYPLAVEDGAVNQIFTLFGMYYENSTLPALFMVH